MSHANPDGSYHIRLSSQPPDQQRATRSIAALSDYLEQCDNRSIRADTHLFLSADDRLTRDDLVRAIPLCINILRIGTTLVFPNGQRFAREDMSANLSFHLVLALATLDEISRNS